jgi:3-mercaptopyruvate sulfurtransferase SseA
MKNILIILFFIINLNAHDTFVKPSELNNMLKDEKLVLLDVSSLASYKKSHIVDALHVNINHFIADKYSEKEFILSEIVQSKIKLFGIDNDSKVVIYSKNRKKAKQDSNFLASLLIKYGFKNVAILEGGYMAWVFEYSFLVSSKKTTPPNDGTFKVID